MAGIRSDGLTRTANPAAVEKGARSWVFCGILAAIATGRQGGCRDIQRLRSGEDTPGLGREAVAPTAPVFVGVDEHAWRRAA